MFCESSPVDDSVSGEDAVAHLTCLIRRILVLAVHVYSDEIQHLLEPPPEDGRIQFHRLNIKNDSRLEGLIKMSDLTINLTTICIPADYNTRPLDTIYSNFMDALPVVKYYSENNKRLIHFSTCEVYGNPIGSFLPKDHSLLQDYLLVTNHIPSFGSLCFFPFAWGLDKLNSQDMGCLMDLVCHSSIKGKHTANIFYYLLVVETISMHSLWESSQVINDLAKFGLMVEFDWA